MILYKYYSNLSYASNDIRKGEVYLSTPQDFNDAFEATLYDEDLHQYISIDKLHILCLSPYYLNQSMWGLYANKEQGVCVGYEVPEKLINCVRYTNDLITKASIDDAINKAKVPQKKKTLVHDMNIRKKSALLKSEDWLHEQEYRIILDEEDSELISKRGCFFVGLKAVIVYAGRKSVQSNQNFQDLLKICNDKSIKVFGIIRGSKRRCLEKGNQIE